MGWVHVFFMCMCESGASFFCTYESRTVSLYINQPPLKIQKVDRRPVLQTSPRIFWKWFPNIFCMNQICPLFWLNIKLQLFIRSAFWYPAAIFFNLFYLSNVIHAWKIPTEKGLRSWLFVYLIVSIHWIICKVFFYSHKKVRILIS